MPDCVLLLPLWSSADAYMGAVTKGELRSLFAPKFSCDRLVLKKSIYVAFNAAAAKKVKQSQEQLASQKGELGG